MKRNFDEWMSTFEDSIATWRYYTDFDKAYKNVDKIKKELETTPDDPYLYFQLGQSYFVMNDMENAYKIFQK